MPRATNKRKRVPEGCGDETSPAQNNRRSTKNTVKFADTIQVVAFDERQRPKSILKSRSAPFPITPESPNPDAPESPPLVPFEQPGAEEEFDTHEAHALSKIAAVAIETATKNHQKRLEQDLAAAQKELAFTKNDLVSVRDNEKILMQALMQAREKAARALADANKSTQTAHAEVKEARLANGRLDNKLKALEGQLKRADGQVEELQRVLAVLKEEKANLEHSLGERSGKGMVEMGNEVVK